MATLEDQTNILVKNYSPKSLARQLAYYKDLDRHGNVYHKVPLEGTYSVTQLLNTVVTNDKKYGDTPQERLVLYKKMMNMNFEKTEKNQYRSMLKFHRHTHLVALSGYLSRIYSRNNNKTKCYRVKGVITSKEITDGKVSIRNFYPAEYVKYVRKFLEDHPPKNWDKNFSTSEHLEYFQKIFTTNSDGTTITKYKCNLCNNNRLILEKSTKNHFKKCKDKKKASEIKN